MKVPAAPDPVVETPAAPLPEPAAPPPPAVATWPAWVKSADAAMLVLVLIAAFMLASNVARNTDVWLHFASGRALLSGEYSLGSDPFSHATAGRAWVNHSWLCSIVAYLLYNADTTGFVIVAVKAFLFAATFAIVALLRRPGKPLWPWVFVMAVAVVAAATHAFLRPIVVSGLFLAITLYLFLKRDGNFSNRLHLIFTGVLFWLWASTDTWFFLGPLTVLVVLIGEVVQQKVWKIREADDDSATGLTVPHLVKALAVGVLACSVTPHHVRVWQLPAELGFHLPSNYQLDPDLAAFTVSPTDQKNYISRSGRGNSPNGLAYAGLLIVGGVVVAVTGLSRLRVSYVLLWIVFAGLSLLQQRLILFFSIVAVPIFATGLSALVERISLGAPDKPRTNLLLMLSSVGRILGLPAALLFVAAAYPGWLHPAPNHPSMMPRVAWAVEPDPGLKRTAEVLNRWRETGLMPPDYHGLIVNFDLANYIAWFAPKEKVFVNSRFAHHGPELTDLVKIRRMFIDPQQQQIDAVEVEALEDFCERHNLIYIAYTGIGAPPLPVNTRPLERLSTFHSYAMWHIDGRAIVLANSKSKQHKADVFRGLAYSPIRQAFHPEFSSPLPPPPPGRLKETREASFLDDFLLDLPKPPPQETLDAFMWTYIADAHSEFDFQMRTGGRVQNPDGSIRITGWPWFAGGVGNPILASAAQSGGYQTSDLAVAYNVLALRAIWRAMAANPDDPEAYYRLADLVGPGQRGVQGRNRNPSRLTIPGLEPRQQLEVVGLRQFIDRLPPPELTARNFASRGFEVAFDLYQHYQPDDATQQGQMMLPEPALPMLLLARKYFDLSDQSERKQQEIDQRKKEFDARVKILEEMMIPVNNDFQKFKALELHAQVRGAIDRNLFLQAIEKFNEALQTKSFGPEPQQLTLLIVRTHLILGQPDIADSYLRELEELNEEAKTKGDPKADELGRVLESFRFQLCQLRGDYAKAGELMEKTIRLPPMTDDEKALVRTAFGKPSTAEYRAYIRPVYLMGLVGGPGVFGQMHNGQIQAAMEKWSRHLDFFLQRGILLALEGKTAEAKTRFQQALKPEGIDVPAFFPKRLTAEQYLRILDQATK